MKHILLPNFRTYERACSPCEDGIVLEMWICAATYRAISQRVFGIKQKSILILNTRLITRSCSTCVAVPPNHEESSRIKEFRRLGRPFHAALLDSDVWKFFDSWKHCCNCTSKFVWRITFNAVLSMSTVPLFVRPRLFFCRPSLLARFHESTLLFAFVRTGTSVDGRHLPYFPILVAFQTSPLNDVIMDHPSM
jgi:hypothetical protein